MREPVIGHAENPLPITGGLPTQTLKTVKDILKTAGQKMGHFVHEALGHAFHQAWRDPNQSTLTNAVRRGLQRFRSNGFSDLPSSAVIILILTPNGSLTTAQMTELQTDLQAELEELPQIQSAYGDRLEVLVGPALYPRTENRSAKQ